MGRGVGCHSFVAAMSLEEGRVTSVHNNDSVSTRLTATFTHIYDGRTTAQLVEGDPRLIYINL
jgi:hypothetical protein